MRFVINSTLSAFARFAFARIVHSLLPVAAVVFPTLFAHAQLTIQNGAVITTTGNYTITLQDIDLINNGEINTTAGTGRLIFTGTGDNTVSGSSNTIFNHLEIAKIGLARISLLQHIGITDSVDFTSGLIGLNNFNILLQPTAALNGETETSYISGDNGGYVEVNTILNAPVAVNPGNLGAIITTTQNPGNTIIRRGQSSQPVTGGLEGHSILRYYDIIPANNTALNATLRINYLDAELNGQTGNTLALWKSTDTVNWTNEGYSTRGETTNYVEKTGIQDFSRWTLSSPTSPLPIIFSSFSVQCVSGAKLLEWVTAQQQNTSRFDVEKSVAQDSWVTIASLAAAGNSSIAMEYTYTDHDPSPDNTLYRIVEYDLNGAATYTPIASSDCDIDGNTINLYPNPVGDLLWISLHTPDVSELKMDLSDSKGSLIREKTAYLAIGSNEYSINMNGLAPGLYFLQFQWNNGNSRKVLKVLKK